MFAFANNYSNSSTGSELSNAWTPLNPLDYLSVNIEPFYEASYHLSFS